MVRSVLALANRPVRTIMTPRPQVAWIDADDDKEEILATMRAGPHRQILVSRRSIDEVIGIARKDDILELLELALGGQPFDVASALHPAVAVPESASVLDALNVF